MATLPSTPQPKLESELKIATSNEAAKLNENNGLKSGQVQNIQTARKSSYERHVIANGETPLPGTYYLKANEARGKHMVQYVYANLTDPNDESLPFHIRERYREIQRERLRGYQPTASPRGTSPTRHHATANYNFAGNKIPRPASASYERRTHNSTQDSGAKPGKYVTDAVRQAILSKANQKAVMKNIQQTRSSNAVLSPKGSGRSRSKTSSPRRRRPFAIAAESTSDTDPIEHQHSVESVPHKSPPRSSGSRHIRRQQYLATKFKLAAKNSKHTQTFVAAVASMEESSGSATTVISRHHSATQTEIKDKSATKTASPSCETAVRSEEKDANGESRNIVAEKSSPTPQNVAKSEAALSSLTEKGQESIEWKRAKVRLRSTPRSPSPPLQESRHRVASADRVRLPSKEKPSCLVGGRAASGHTGLASCASPAPPVSEKRFTTSATQIEEHKTTETGVQVKLKKKRSPSQRRARKERRSPSQRSVASKISSQSGSKIKDEKENIKKTKKKKKKAKSRDPSLRSLRSLRSLQSDASTGILKHVTIGNSSTSPAISQTGRSASAAALGETTKKKKKKSKLKKKKSASKIAKFLRTLSKDKEAIQVISKMAAAKKKGSKQVNNKNNKK